MGVDVQLATIARLDKAALRYGDEPEVLRDISFNLAAGSFHFLLGPSGAGKTSLLRLLSLAKKPTRGRVELFGCDVGAASRSASATMRRRIGVVFQDFRLLPQLSVRDNVMLPLLVAGIDKQRARMDSQLFITRLGLDHLADSRPSSLSGGQQQLVAVARALIVRPRLLIADEPTASVDDALALRLIILCREMNRLGTTVLIATHSEQLADRYAYPKLRIQKGRLIANQ